MTIDQVKESLAQQATLPTENTLAVFSLVATDAGDDIDISLTAHGEVDDVLSILDGVLRETLTPIQRQAFAYVLLQEDED